MGASPLLASDLTRKSFVRNLFEVVVQPGVCSGCAACVLACPVDALDYQVDRPLLLDSCIDCQLCSTACPRLRPASAWGRDEQDEARPEVAADGRLGDPLQHIGPFRKLVAARATAPAVRAAGQDGGLVTGLLIWALEKGLIDGAVVCRRSTDGAWLPEPALVTHPADLVACAGSAYTYSPNTLALREAERRGLTKLAFVGTGCQINGLHQLRGAKSKKLRAIADRVVFAVGLLCSETFTYEGFMHEQIARGLGVDLADVVKINIKGKVLITLRSGEVRGIPLKAVRPHARMGCHYCQDFAAEHADLSAGGLGLEGWNIATLRSEVAEALFARALEDGALEAMPAGAFPAALDLYDRLALKQRERPARPAPGE